MRVLLALIALVVGVVLIFIPGPAFVFFILAGGLLASESKHVARAGDWTELRVRSVSRWVARMWCGMSTATKVLMASTLTAVGGGGTFL
ncbi:MAG: PGPGW domain-containing protein, partial [Opitutaceae bacterium]